MLLTLIRHAEAGRRHEWTSLDADRPLDEIGWLQAERLAAAIEVASTTRLMTSPFVRCVQTLEPLAAAQSATIEADEQLGEQASVYGLLELLATLLDDDVDAVLCSHGNIIPVLVQGLAERGMAPKGVLPCAKGSYWTLDTASGTPAQYTAPLA